VHELFDTLAGEVDAHSDELAERIAALGGQAFGSARQVAKASVLQENEATLSRSADLIAAVASRYGELGKMVRHAIETSADAGDANTSDLLTGMSRNLDLRLWFLESHLEG
jgi:starvation-inducible DNA-binding protein